VTRVVCLGLAGAAGRTLRWELTVGAISRSRPGAEESRSGDRSYEKGSDHGEVELELCVDGRCVARIPLRADCAQTIDCDLPVYARDGAAVLHVLDGAIHRFELRDPDGHAIAAADLGTPRVGSSYPVFQALAGGAAFEPGPGAADLVGRLVASALFDASAYAARAGRDFSDKRAAVLHYLGTRDNWGLDTSDWFDADFVSRQMPSAEHARVSPLEWYVHADDAADIGPNPVFSNRDFRHFVAELPAGARACATVFDAWLDAARLHPVRPSALIDPLLLWRQRHPRAKYDGAKVLDLIRDWLTQPDDRRTPAALSPFFDEDWLEQCFVLLRNRPAGCLLAAWRLGLMPDQAPHPVLQSGRNGRDYYQGLAAYELRWLRERVDDVASAAPAIDAVRFLAPANALADVPAWAKGRSALLRYLLTDPSVARASFLHGLDDAFVAGELPGLVEFARSERGIGDVNRLWARWLRLMGVPGNYADAIRNDGLVLRLRDLLALRAQPRPDPGVVRASFVIPTYARDDLVLRCLASALNFGAVEGVEFVVSEDAAHVDAGWLLPYFASFVQWRRNPANLGFLRNCNAAVAGTRGPVVVLVNNDVVLHEHALEELLATFDAHASAAVVGGLVLNADGTVQENGGVVWQEAAAANHHRGWELYEEFAFNVRPADYVSGCWIGIRRAAWDRLGGFDERFAPAYYEETDLCFAARAAGMEVLVNPQSTVTHLDGATMGRDEGDTASLKLFQSRNRTVFADKWRDVLAHAHGIPGAVSPFHTGRDDGSRFVSLVFDHYVPEPDRDAGSRAMFYACRELSQVPGNYVMFVPANDHRSRYAPALERLGIEVLTGPNGRKRLAGLVDAHAHRLRLALVSRLAVAQHYRELIARLPCRKALYIHDIETLRAFPATGCADAIERRVRAGVEFYVDEYRGALDLFDDVISLSGDETALLKPYLGDRLVDVFPYELDELPPASAAADRRDVIFVGSYNHPPNREAVGYFLKHVWPTIGNRYSNVRLHLCGSGFEQAAIPGANNVVLHGSVSDGTLRHLYSVSRIAVVPLLSGAGLKGKVIEACMHRTVCVGTDLAWQGLALPQRYAFLAGDIDSFADRFARAYDAYDETMVGDLVNMCAALAAAHPLRERIRELVAGERERRANGGVR
jgi:GT2 family glycosyltransferase